jgi:membrane protease YdiL (CAAX protease family)
MEDRTGRPLPAPWSVGEILVVLYLWVFFWPPLARLALSETRLLAAYYGADAVAIADADPEQRLQQRAGLALFVGPGTAESFLAEAQQRLLGRFQLWTLAVAFPFQLVSVPLLLFLTGRTRPGQLGLTTRRLGWKALGGVIAAAVLTPFVFGLNYAVQELCNRVVPGRVQEHPLTAVTREHIWPAEWVLVFFVAMVAAPVMEELVFRGLLQRYFASIKHGGRLAVGAALVLAGAACGREAWSARSGPVVDLLSAAAPILFVLGMVPLYLVVEARSLTSAMPAIFGTALAFAALHSSVWPTPVALFVLGLGLGVLAWRSGSLAGPIVLHGLFNGVNCVLLLLPEHFGS